MQCDSLASMSTFRAYKGESNDKASTMKATELIRMSLVSGKDWLIRLIFDMKHAPLTQPTPRGGNHPLWVLAHVIYSESDLLDVFLLGKPNRFPELENCRPGSQPTTNASDYLTMDELLIKFEHVRADSLQHLATLADDDLDEKRAIQSGERVGTTNITTKNSSPTRRTCAPCAPTSGSSHCQNCRREPCLHRLNCDNSASNPIASGSYLDTSPSCGPASLFQGRCPRRAVCQSL